MTRTADVEWRPPGAEPDRGRVEPDPSGPSGPDPSGPSLADVVARAWEVLGAELPAGCPVCGGELVPRPHAAGGRCASCGSTLS